MGTREEVLAGGSIYDHRFPGDARKGPPDHASSVKISPEEKSSVRGFAWTAEPAASGLEYQPDLLPNMMCRDRGPY